MPRLILFDIDGTLLDTGGAGGASLLDAVEQVFGVDRTTIPPLNLAGATDGGIVRQLFSHVGCEMDERNVRGYMSSYLANLRQRLNHEDFSGVVLPGVPKLLEDLMNDGSVDIGLLTGNVRKGAEMKLTRFELQHHFLEGAFGDDAEDRNLLGPVAIRRMTTLTGRTYTAEDVIVIGDTPKDIACAHAIGARCLAVGTGNFTVEALCAYQPWVCLENLADNQYVLDLLVG